jgi:hypothetical protein
MAANDTGTFKYWHWGEIDKETDVPANDGGTFKYWSWGEAERVVYPAGSPPASTFKPLIMWFQ